MRILFGALHFGCFRNFESVIVRLAGQGHKVRLAADVEDVMGGTALVERLAAAYPGITHTYAPSLTEWRLAPLAGQVRRALECLRFAAPEYDRLVKYRNRAYTRAPRGARSLVTTGGGRTPAGRDRWMRRLQAIERSIPPPEALVTWMRAESPDLVLLASVTNDGAPQMDHLKAALSLGLRTAMPVYSWDHLSGKAVVHVHPHRLLVWNETQRREATEQHGFDADRVTVTGAQAYDQWFDRQPARSRDLFHADLGLDPSKPTLLYVCSVLSRPTPPEAPFVLEWIRRVRASEHPALAEANIIVRPHPERAQEWAGVDLEGLGRVVVRGRNPIDPNAKAEYFDSIHHSAAVVGIITSAFIEAAVLGRPSLTVEDPRFREHQEGSPHYHYLADRDRGLLLVAATMEEHVAQLRDVLADPRAADRRTRDFIAWFVRPYGSSVSSTERFVDAVVALGRIPAPAPESFGAGASRVLADAVRRVTSWPSMRPFVLSDEEAARVARPEEERRLKEAREREREARQARLRDHEARQAAATGAERREKDARRRARLDAKAAVRAGRAQAKAAVLAERARQKAQRAHDHRTRARRAAWARLKGRVKQAIGLGAPR